MKEKLTIIFVFIVYLFITINSIVVMHNIIIEAEGWANIILSVIDSLMFSFALFVAGFYLWDEIKEIRNSK
jgi:hypothetical protein